MIIEILTAFNRVHIFKFFTQISNVIEVNDFNCTSEVERLVTQIKAQKAVENIKMALREYRRMSGLGSCDWIKCRFWCNDDFQSTSHLTAVLDYIKMYNNVGCDQLSIKSCEGCGGSVNGTA